jgi:hypothetical protein
VKPAFGSVDGPCGASVCASCAACVAACVGAMPSVPKGAVGIKCSDRSTKKRSASKVSSQKFFSSMEKKRPELRPGPENNRRS